MLCPSSCSSIYLIKRSNNNTIVYSATIVYVIAVVGVASVVIDNVTLIVYHTNTIAIIDIVVNTIIITLKAGITWFNVIVVGIRLGNTVLRCRLL